MKNRVAPVEVSEQAVLSLEDFKASRFLEDGKYHISMGDLEPAMECFQKSIEVKPTSHAYNYLAWVLSMQEEFDAAIELCQKAIRLDPSWGTPYNDIGSYLIQKGKIQDAIPWLEKAKRGFNQDSPHFPYINLGRAYTSLGAFEEAIGEFRRALEISPGHKEIQKVLEELEEIQNNA